ncbi:MAG: phage protein Gp27 family protein [Desulfobacteria bacterium]
MAPRRKHFKAEALPPEVLDALNRQLAEGRTYREVADWLDQMGHPVAKSSVARYGRDFLGRLERLRVIKDQARAIVEESPDKPATELAEATNQLAMQLIMESLLKMEDLGEMKGAKTTDLFKALSLLERSAVAREKLKLDFRVKVEKATQKIEEIGRAKGLDPETLKVIREQVYGLI